MAPPSHPLAECEAGGLLSSKGSKQRHSQERAEPGKFGFFLKSHKAKPLYEKTHAAWISTFKQEVTSLTDLTATGACRP